MPTASFEKFQPALELMLEGGNLGTETYSLKLATVRNLSAGTMTETTNGNGYTTGGVAVTVNSAAQSGGTYTLTLTQPGNPIWTASGAGFTFQYVILTGSVSGNIASWDYGSSQAVAAGETVSVTITTVLTVA
jgi:hypothetical protein